MSRKIIICRNNKSSAGVYCLESVRCSSWAGCACRGNSCDHVPVMLALKQQYGNFRWG